MSVEHVVINCLREVKDLDGVLQIYVSNPAADRYPALQKWLHIIVGEERHRRDGGDHPEFTYSKAGIELVDNQTLSQSALFASGAIEWAYVTDRPTLIKFAIELSKTLTAVMASRL